MRHNKYSWTLICIITLSSCTKVVDLKLGNNSGKLVIEGNVTNLSGPQTITLSRNVAFTNTNTYPPVTGATISVTDEKGNDYNFVEGLPGTYSSTSLTGLSGEKFTMNVVTNGTTYSASSVMPAVVSLDSLSTRVSDLATNDQREIRLYFHDPPKIANQYRFILSVNNKQVNRIFTFDDEFSDGRYVSLDLLENDINIYPADTVKVEMQCIDKPVYTYWFTLMQQSTEGPGGGVTPANPPSNITPLTLGYFSAHTSQSITIIVK